MYACGFLDLIMEVRWYVWPFRQPMLAAAGWVISPDCRSNVPDAPAAAVQQNSRGQRPQLAAPR